MKTLMCVLGVLFLSSSGFAGGREDYSVTPGGGNFYALRHRRGEGKTTVEVVGSPIALQRARNQSRKGGYELDVEGPFSWHTEAAAYIRKNWDPYFGKPRPAGYLPRFRTRPERSESEPHSVSR